MIKQTEYGSWRARVYHGGKQVDSKTFKTKREAKAWHDQQEAKFNTSRGLDPKLRKTKLRDAADVFLEARKGAISDKGWDSEEALLRCHLPDWLAPKPIDDVTPADLDRMWVEIMRRRARGTASRVRDVMVSLFTWARKNGYTQDIPTQDSKIPKGTGQDQSKEKVVPFTAAELAALIATVRATHEGYADMIEFVSLTGLRWGEVKSLRATALLHDGDVPYILVSKSQSDRYEENSTKSRKPRKVPMVPRALELFQKQLNHLSVDGRVFGGSQGGKLHGSPFKRAVKWDRISGGHRFHDLRHTAATRWLRSGIDVHTVSTWLGHSKPTTTLKYYSHYMGSSSDAAALLRLATTKLD
ncbi:MAG: site-specific integrase [Actinobacteria bacterium]|nr:site-specific integrase [Actinomycetota bacterium]MBU1609496.1 site-specific integrase [Actinomycetota bacterium]MBU2315331.1 site-specific integrase [Actinomycetota bacterium]MBU2385529.1 site-specific integrase [Actinomycetota bacterium]